MSQVYTFYHGPPVHVRAALRYEECRWGKKIQIGCSRGHDCNHAQAPFVVTEPKAILYERFCIHFYCLLFLSSTQT